MKLREVKTIYIHGSDSDWGTDEIINFWHKQRGFKSLYTEGKFVISTGYNFVILNSKMHYKLPSIPTLDGSIEPARSINQVPAQVKYDNKYSIGICLIGKKRDGKIPYTLRQIQSSFSLCMDLLYIYPNLKIEDIKGHYEYWTERNQKPLKTCPDINMNLYREYFTKYMVTGGLALNDYLKLK